jgi:hypothetical protein
MAHFFLAFHACHPSYSGGRDQEDHGSKPARANGSRDPILKNSSHKRAGGVAPGVDPKFKSQYCKKKKNLDSLYPKGSPKMHAKTLSLSTGHINI